jgi:RNA polymerase sigma factor (TIGR02999 family)
MSDSESPAAGASGLAPELYAELKQIAHARLARHRAGNTLNCTSLVHEAYLKIQASDAGPEPDAAGDHYLATVSLAMRQILVDYARVRAAPKHGGDAVRVTLQESQVAAEEASLDVLALDEALARLARHDTDLEKLVVLRFFGGLSMDRVAVALNKPKRTVERDWTRARVYLYRAMSDLER